MRAMALRCVHYIVRKSNFYASTVIPKRFRYYWEARPENKWRKLVMQVTLPRLGLSPAFEPKIIKDDPDTLYGLDVVLHREAKEVLRDCKMIAVFLKSQMEVTDFFRMRHELRKKDILLDQFPNHVMIHALKDFPHENLSALYHAGDTLTVYSLEPKVTDMLKITKKNPYVALMGGLIENRLLSASQVVDYSKLPSLETAQAMLSHTMSEICSSTHGLLQQNQTQTVNYLEQYIKDQTQS